MKTCDLQAQATACGRNWKTRHDVDPESKYPASFPASEINQARRVAMLAMRRAHLFWPVSGLAGRTASPSHANVAQWCMNAACMTLRAMSCACLPLRGQHTLVAGALDVAVDLVFPV